MCVAKIIDLTHFEKERQETHGQLDGDTDTRNCSRQASSCHHVLVIDKEIY